MLVRIRLFAALRERAGRREVELELPDGARVEDALERLGELTFGTPVVMAVNQEYAGADTPLQPGDELALIPPVSGGQEPDRPGARLHCRITGEPLDLGSVLERVRDSQAGAIVTFHGVTREVPALEYEAYEPMAARQISEILRTAAERHGLCAAAAEHRTGQVALSEPSILIAVSAPHRDAAFAGGREIIDRIKQLAPIWKREEGVWVEGDLPDARRSG